jgi:hypothetical protein
VKLGPDRLICLGIPVLRDLRVRFHALVVLSDLVVGSAFEMFNDEIVQELQVLLRPDLVSSPFVGETFVNVESIGSMAFLSKLLGYSPHQGCVGLCVNSRAETSASRGQAAGTGGLKSERGYRWG